MNNYSRISLQQLEIMISLGVSDAERSKLQSININIDIDFSQSPLACLTDQLKDTYCYDSFIQQLKLQITSRSFHLLEHVTYEIYQLAKEFFTESHAVHIKVTKKPLLSSSIPIEGASFCYGDK